MLLWLGPTGYNILKRLFSYTRVNAKLGISKTSIVNRLRPQDSQMFGLK